MNEGICKKAREREREKRKVRQKVNREQTRVQRGKTEQYLIVLYNTLCCVPGSNCFLSFKGELSVVTAPGLSQHPCKLTLLIYVI